MSRETVIRRLSNPDITDGITLLQTTSRLEDLASYIATLLDLYRTSRASSLVLDHALGRYMLLLTPLGESTWRAGVARFVVPLLDGSVGQGRTVARRFYLEAFRDPRRFYAEGPQSLGKSPGASIGLPMDLIELFALHGEGENPADYGITAEVLTKVDWRGRDRMKQRFANELAA